MKKQAGFSLMEILVAVAILTVVMGLAIVSSQGSRRVARDSQRRLELEEIRSALEIYRIDEGSYPATDSLGSLVSDYVDTEAITDPVSTTYRYAYLNTGSGTYRLCAYFETEDVAAVSLCSGANAGSNCGVGTAVNCNYEVNQP